MTQGCFCMRKAAWGRVGGPLPPLVLHDAALCAAALGGGARFLKVRGSRFPKVP